MTRIRTRECTQYMNNNRPEVMSRLFDALVVGALSKHTDDYINIWRTRDRFGIIESKACDDAVLAGLER